jgi:hypothetical protein
LNAVGAANCWTSTDTCANHTAACLHSARRWRGKIPMAIKFACKP